MYISDKILAYGTTRTDTLFVVIKSEDYPDEPGMRRTTYDHHIAKVISNAQNSQFGYHSHPDSSNSFVGVEVEKLRQFRPAWVITNAELLEQYQAMQREDGSGPLKNIDLRRDPELLKKAKELWSEQVKKTKTT